MADAADEGTTTATSRNSIAQHEIAGVPVPPAKVEHLKRSTETLKRKLKSMAALEVQMRATGEQQVSLTDRDARA